ncbi:hypothetical protein ABFS83_05G013100 [Erythranthe nasuta]
MDSLDQRRKRKRSFRQYPNLQLLLSVRSLLICFSFLIFLYLFSYTNPFSSIPVFRPVLVVSSLSLLSTSISTTVKSVQNSESLTSPPLKIESRVLFPDHVLLLVGGGSKNMFLNNEFECIYNHVKNGGFGKKKVVSFDEYDEFRSVLRCPLPSLNYSNVVKLQRVDKNRVLAEKSNGFLRRNQTVKSWENIAYEAALDGDTDTAVVFVKGLNLRPGRESDPSRFSCHFGFGHKNPIFTLSTKALAVAQEVVRCPFPESIEQNLEKGIRVTVGFNRAHKPVLLPSVAKIFRPGPTFSSAEKHDLCVCTMVWNQASAIREWIKYHSWLGVEKWFIYDNNSEDGIEGIVQELNQENHNVTRFLWPWIKTQEAGFSHCALKAKSQCNWISFMDVDEYFYFPYSTPKHQQFRSLGHAPQNSLRDLVANFSRTNIGEIRTSCHSFGPSGLDAPPPQGVTVGYTCRLQSPERHKSIVRPDALDSTLLNVVHHFRLREGFEYLNLPQSAAVINHYKYQVWGVFRAKFYRRVATYVADWRENQNEGSRDRAPGLGTKAIEPSDWSKKFCEVWDTGLRDFVLANFVDFSTNSLPWEKRYD